MYLYLCLSQTLNTTIKHCKKKKATNKNKNKKEKTNKNRALKL